MPTSRQEESPNTRRDFDLVSSFEPTGDLPDRFMGLAIEIALGIGHLPDHRRFSFG